MRIQCDAARCYIKEADYIDIEVIKSATMWVNKSIEYQRSQKRTKENPIQYCLNEIDNSFPTGLLDTVIDQLEEERIKYSLDYSITLNPTQDYLSSWTIDGIEYTPDKWQSNALRVALDNPRTCIQAPTGGGKTFLIGMYAHHFPNSQILVIVTTGELLKKTAKVLSNMLGEKIGEVGDGKKKWERVTVITNKSALIAIKDKNEFIADTEVLIVDEVHKAGAESYTEVSNKLSKAYYRLGVTATFERGDGGLKVIEGNVGPLRVVESEAVLISRGRIEEPKIRFIYFKNPERDFTQKARFNPNRLIIGYNTPDGKPIRDEVYKKQIISCPKRNQLIVDLVNVYLENPKYKGYALVLVERLEHGGLLQTMFSESRQGEVHFLHGESNRDYRKQVFEDFEKGNHRLLIASNILQEGVDIPGIELGVNAGGGSSAINTVQRIGRTVRKSDIAKAPFYIDIFDSEPYYLNNNSKSRQYSAKNRYPKSVKSLSLSEFLNELNNDT